MVSKQRAKNIVEPVVFSVTAHILGGAPTEVWRMAPNGNGFVRVESADSMEEPLLSPGFTSTVERPVEDLLVSRQRAEFSAEPLHFFFPRNEEHNDVSANPLSYRS